MHRLAAVLGDDRVPAEHIEIFPLVIGNPPFAGRRLPDARIEATFGRLQVPGAELRIAGNDAVRIRCAELGFSSVYAEGDVVRHGTSDVISQMHLSRAVLISLHGSTTTAG